MLAFMTCHTGESQLNVAPVRYFTMYILGQKHGIIHNYSQIHNSKVIIHLVDSRRCFIFGGSGNGRRQNSLLTQLDRHTANQRNEAFDVGSATARSKLPKAWPT